MSQEKVIKVDTEIQNADINDVVKELNDENIDETSDIEQTDNENNDNQNEENIINNEDTDMDNEDTDNEDIDNEETDMDEDEKNETENNENTINTNDINDGGLDNNIKLSDILDENEDENNIVVEEEDDEIDDIEDDDDIEDTYDDSDFYKKIEKETSYDILSYYHPFNKKITDNELYTLINVVRNTDNIIIDPLHRTLPILTKYEKARILGVRAKQLNNGAMPFVKLNEDVIDSFLIAEKELKEKKLPFIIQRPLPNGNSEYWKLEDLEYTY